MPFNINAAIKALLAKNEIDASAFEEAEEQPAQQQEVQPVQVQPVQQVQQQEPVQVQPVQQQEQVQVQPVQQQQQVQQAVQPAGKAPATSTTTTPVNVLDRLEKMSIEEAQVFMRDEKNREELFNAMRDKSIRG